MPDPFAVKETGVVGANGLPIRAFDDSRLQKYIDEASKKVSANEAFVEVAIPDFQNGGLKLTGGVVVPLHNGSQTISVAGVFMHTPSENSFAGQVKFKWGIH